jgi:hypothetical protein
MDLGPGPTVLRRAQLSLFPDPVSGNLVARGFRQLSLTMRHVGSGKAITIAGVVKRSLTRSGGCWELVLISKGSTFVSAKDV